MTVALATFSYLVIYICCNPTYLNEEVNCTEPSPPQGSLLVSLLGLCGYILQQSYMELHCPTVQLTLGAGAIVYLLLPPVEPR